MTDLEAEQLAVVANAFVKSVASEARLSRFGILMDLFP
jgi:hypothetical protein|tara:strand:- start:982 stop:1095 length:114 start_codon:yes stop_codon:yes gene_type:complete